ncbi:MAG: beta-lactamase family protein, partial [Clostridia bacterium]|nr:beta-lactamase family protein [Clostridia bacterium]
MFEKTLELIESGIGTAYPCAAVAVGRGYDVYLRRFCGKRQIQPYELDLTEDTLFDLASLSKLVSATMIALKFLEEGKLALRDSVGMYIKNTGNFSGCDVIHLLTHTSGLTPHLPLYKMTHENGVTETILSSAPLSKPGEQVHYSCMGYMVLKEILETIGGESLDSLAEKYVFSPLGMKTACYNPQVTRPSLPTAATEFRTDTGEWSTGHVHDENAYYLGGVSGNAGVFASLDDMISFAGMCSSRGRTADGEIYLTQRVFDLAVMNRTPDCSESRGLGFQLMGRQYSPMGDL